MSRKVYQQAASLTEWGNRLAHSPILGYFRVWGYFWGI